MRRKGMKWHYIIILQTFVVCVQRKQAMWKGFSQLTSMINELVSTRFICPRVPIHAHTCVSHYVKVVGIIHFLKTKRLNQPINCSMNYTNCV